MLCVSAVAEESINLISSFCVGDGSVTLIAPPVVSQKYAFPAAAVKLADLLSQSIERDGNESFATVIELSVIPGDVTFVCAIIFYLATPAILFEETNGNSANAE